MSISSSPLYDFHRDRELLLRVLDGIDNIYGWMIKAALDLPEEGFTRNELCNAVVAANKPAILARGGGLRTEGSRIRSTQNTIYNYLTRSPSFKNKGKCLWVWTGIIAKDATVATSRVARAAMRDACHCTTPAHPAPYLPNPAGDGHPWQAPRSHSYLGWQPQGTSGMYLPRDVTMAACPSGGAVVAVADSAGSRLPASTGSYPIRQKSNDIFGPFGPQGTSISLYDGAAPILQVSDSYGPQSTGVARIVGYPVQGPNLPSWNPGMLVDSPSMVIQPSFGGMYDFGFPAAVHDSFNHCSGPGPFTSTAQADYPDSDFSRFFQ